MKKTIVFILFIVAVIAVNQVNASTYSIDEQKIDELFETATETNMISMNTNELATAPSDYPLSLTVPPGEKDVVVAIVLDAFLGWAGIHRFYLGTEVLTGLGYILTCGGIFGIVPFVDFIVLIVDHDNISPYIDNPKFFMW